MDPFVLNVNPPCSHPRAALHRQPWSTGKGWHLVELCRTCLGNVRGPGIWVSRAEAIARGLNPDELPFAPARIPEHQPSLFDALQGGEAAP
jgi:hypothetical protein